MGETLIEEKIIGKYIDQKRKLRLKFLEILENLNVKDAMLYCSKAIQIVSKNNDLRNYDKYDIKITKDISRYTNNKQKWILTSHITNDKISHYKYIKGLRSSYAILLLKTEPTF